MRAGNLLTCHDSGCVCCSASQVISCSRCCCARCVCRSEALRLDQFCTALKSDVTFMRDKLAAIEEDRLWLESKLKNGLKAGGNRFLASQLQAASASTSMLSGSASSARLSSTTGSTGSAKIGLAPGTAPSGAGRGARTKLTVPGMTVAPLTRPAKPAAATAASPADAAPSLAILQSEDYGADTLVSESGSLEAATPATAPAHASRLASMQSGAPSDIQTKIAALERRVEKLTAKNTQLKASNAALKSARCVCAQLNAATNMAIAACPLSSTTGYMAHMTHRSIRDPTPTPTVQV